MGSTGGWGHGLGFALGGRDVRTVRTLIAISLPINYLAGTGLNIQSWTKENAIVIAMLPVVIAPLLFRPRWVQIGAPIVLIVPAGRYSDGVIDRTLRCPGQGQYGSFGTLARCVMGAY